MTSPRVPVPPRRKDLVVSDVEDGNETLFLDSASDTVVSLNSTAAAIWYLCDGQRTAEDILAEVASVRGEVARDVLERDVNAAIALLRKHALLHG
jgi:hypothetical protein